MSVPSFDKIYQRAAKRKGGERALLSLMPSYAKESELLAVSDDRCLATMAKCVNQAGFSWSVIEKKWPEFEEAYFGFKIDTLLMLSEEQWEAYVEDTRIVRSWQKIKAVKDNALFIYDIQYEHGSFSKYLANWPKDDLVGLLADMKRRGSRLGGNTGQRVLRYLGKDAFMLTRDVVLALQDAGLEIKDAPSSKSELQKIQNVFNEWSAAYKLPFCHLSRILSCSVGENFI